MTKEDWIEVAPIKNIDESNSFSDRYQKGEIDFKSMQHEIAFLYEMGLFYSKHYSTHDPDRIYFRKDDKYYLAIYYYLKGIKIYEENKTSIDTDFYFVREVVARLYVNIGNEYGKQFRTINALSYYRHALEIDDCFDMAIGNFALGIEHHNPLIGLEDNKYRLVFNLIYRLFLSIHIDDLDSGQEFFRSKKGQYLETRRAYINTIAQGMDANYDPYACFTDIRADGDSYDDWCVTNTLYLNFINDLGNYEEAKFDIELRRLNNDLDLTDAQLCSLDNMYDQFKLQRKKMFKYKDLKDIEELYELAQVFQCLYSYFDKVAFFIYKFFKLTGNDRSVNINSIWAMEDEDENNLMLYKNQYLYNIYWLRKEYRANERDNMNINELLSPDAQDYADIRNMLEHKEFSFRKVEELPYLDPHSLFDKTLKISNVVRNMILSIIQMIKVEKALIDPITNKRDLSLVNFTNQGF